MLALINVVFAIILFRNIRWPEDDLGRCRLLEKLMLSINEVAKAVIVVIFYCQHNGIHSIKFRMA